MTGVRGVIAARMAESARTAAAVTLTTEADATDLADLRDRLSDRRGEGEQTRIPFDAILVKIVAVALRQHPRLNALLAGDEIQVMRDVDIAVAVDTERGLLTPVLRKADTKGVIQVADELAELVGRARLGKSQPEDLEGGTFTITNLGMHEIDAFTPIINPPQCAVLGVGRVCPRPVVRADGLCIRKTVWLSLTFDHRMVDGAPAARFLQCVKQYVEQPGDILD
jgi:pyruvate dehydrogenase E2 component (dihydrolipoamide acetyltransferase)